MAIDTAEKRKSISGIHLYASGPGVTSNAAKDSEWRTQAGYGYPIVAAVTFIPRLMVVQIMDEQTLLGAMGTALITAVSGLVWVMRRSGSNHKGNSGGLEHSLLRLNEILDKQTDVLQKLLTTTEVHNAQNQSMHEAMIDTLRDMQRR